MDTENTLGKKNGLENHVYSEITRKFCYKEMAGNTLN